MKRTILTTAAILAAVMMINVPIVMATAYQWDGADSTAWNEPNNWTANSGYPSGAGDTATFPSSGVSNEPTVNIEVTVGSVTVDTGRTLTLGADLSTGSLDITGTVNTDDDTLTVSSENGLTINSNGLLHVDDAGTVVLSGGGTSQTIDGSLTLDVSGSTLSITNSCTIEGDGSITGSSDSAAIEIAGTDKTLTSEVTIAGALRIVGAQGSSGTTFINSGSVRANTAGTLEVFPDALDAGSAVSGSWYVETNANAELWVRTASVQLSGSINLSTGTLDIDQNITTSDQFNFTGGSIEVAAQKSFSASQ